MFMPSLPAAKLALQRNDVTTTNLVRLSHLYS